MTSSADQTKPTITALIIAKNEASMIANCLETVAWCDEIIVLDTGSEDTTAQIAESMGARVVSFASPDFATLRNEALKRAKTDWVIYIDADERVIPTLAKEIRVHLETTKANALSFYRQNIHFGQILLHGGWDEDLVTRVFRRRQLIGWYGKIHESPRFEGETTLLHSPLLHLTHRNTIQGLHKTVDWTPKEAELLYQANIPPVTLLTLLRKGTMEVLRRAIFKQGYKDGMAGWIEALVQGMNRMLVYIQVWERQQTPTLSDQYLEHEQEIARLWKAES